MHLNKFHNHLAIIIRKRFYVITSHITAIGQILRPASIGHVNNREVSFPVVKENGKAKRCHKNANDTALK